jgi:hypothetical protein
VTCDDFGEGKKQKWGPTSLTGSNELCLTCDDTLRNELIVILDIIYQQIN